jgi:hypothetical protein
MLQQIKFRGISSLESFEVGFIPPPPILPLAETLDGLQYILID